MLRSFLLKQLSFPFVVLSLFATSSQVQGQDSKELVLETTAPLSLQEKIDAFDGKIIARPSQHAGAMESIIVDFTIDGFSGQHMALKGPLVSLKGSVPNNWNEDPSSTSKYSIAFRNRYENEVYMTFTVFSKTMFPLTYNEDSIIAYLAGLKKIHRDRLNVDKTPPSFKDMDFNAHLLSAETIYIDYSISNRDEQLPKIRHLTYFILVEDKFWVELSLNGPENKIGTFIDTYNRYLRNLSVVQNESEAFGHS